MHKWADLHGHTVVADVTDVDVSGDTDPFTRPGLGPWLTDRVDEWDILVVYKLDRLSRRLSHFSGLVDWATERGKSIAVIDNHLDTSTPAGLLVAQVLAMFAQFERTTIQGRMLDAKAKRRSKGRWNGGNVPYPYRPVPGPEGGSVLVPDPDSVAVLNEIVARVLEGEAATAVANDLTARGVPTPVDRQAVIRGGKPKGRRWTATAVLGMLRGRAILGESWHNGEPVRGEDGHVVRFGEPVVSAEVYARLQAALAPRPPRRTAAVSGLLDVVFCAQCGGKMYSALERAKGRELWRLRCANKTRFRTCTARQVPLEDVRDIIATELLAAYGDRQLLERVYDPGEDHTAEIEDSTGALMYLVQQAAGKPEAVRAVYAPRIAALEAEIEALSAMPSRPAGYVYRETGQTFGEAWTAGDAEAQRRLLVRAGVRAKVGREPDGGVFVGMSVDPKVFDMVSGS